MFVIKINGALSTSTYSEVKLINGAQAKNVYWKVEGAVTINNYSVFKGTIICNNGALGAINTGVRIDGRALTTNGALSTTATTVIAQTIPGNCASVGLEPQGNESHTVSLYPNPFASSVHVVMSEATKAIHTIKIFNAMGIEVLSREFIQKLKLKLTFFLRKFTFIRLAVQT